MLKTRESDKLAELLLISMGQRRHIECSKANINTHKSGLRYYLKMPITLFGDGRFPINSSFYRGHMKAQIAARQPKVQGYILYINTELWAKSGGYNFLLVRTGRLTPGGCSPPPLLKSAQNRPKTGSKSKCFLKWS